MYPRTRMLNACTVEEKRVVTNIMYVRDENAHATCIF
jgi:hypothetical protein